ncbi:MAG: MmcQ/YjbR family DNA-binding protein, partial [Lachnospiraceae bacterium]|nr:MmcQ/YjbR family DNA-binding protein [Lachnospiraceae bacterium]
HEDNKKWFALMMPVKRNKLGLPGGDIVDVINLKIDDMFLKEILLREPGIMPAYHMNKMHWITVLLDGTVEEDRICDLIGISYEATASKKKKEKLRGPKDWVIPANPSYFDVVHAFDDVSEIRWHQSSGIRKGDTVFIYVGAPVSAILFGCKVTETGIPREPSSRNPSLLTRMNLKLFKRYEPCRFTFKTLKEEYGIYAVRGPRGIPHSLSVALRK